MAHFLKDTFQHEDAKLCDKEDVMDIRKVSYETDVLVLGSSAAGCGAAISARRAGAEVLLLDKGRLESSGCLGGGNDHFMAVLDEVEHDSLQDMYDVFVTPTSGLSRTMVKRWYDAQRECIDVLEDSGIELMRNPDGTYLRSLGFGQPGPWWIHINHGYTVKHKLAKYIKKLGIKVVNNVLVTHLIKDGDNIAGCAGFDVLKGDFVTIRCKTAVLCLGLTVSRVSNNSTHKPFNIWYSPYVTGSQILLPLEAGAGIVNLDIADAGTLIPKSWGAPGMNGINNMGGKELNARGERFMFRYDPCGENCVRRNQVMGTFNEMMEGAGPPFVMDMTHFSPEDARHLQYDLMPGDKETYLDYCNARGIDFTKEPLEVEISERILGGMVDCDDNQESSIHNCFVGCVTGTFSGAMCLGWTAGRSAAERAAQTDMPHLNEAKAEEICKELFAPLQTTVDRSVSYTEFEDGLRQVMDYYVGYQRTEASLRQALKSFTVLERFLPRIAVHNLRELMRMRESLELFKVCRIYIQACMQRRESGRALYRRADYPNLDPSLNKCLITRLDGNGNPVFQWKD